MTEAFKVDRLDLRILAQLQKNGRMTNVDVADAVGLSPSPCLLRVKRLEQAGYIAKTSSASKPRSGTSTRSWSATWSAAATTTCCAS